MYLKLIRLVVDHKLVGLPTCIENLSGCRCVADIVYFEQVQQVVCTLDKLD